MRKRCGFGWMVLLALSVCVGVAGQLPSVVLEEAIHAEETQGDLNKAIGLYETVVADTQAQRPAVAQAYYRLGLCYLKKGDAAKAATTLQALVSQYPEQEGLTDKARAKLREIEPALDANGPVVLSTSPAFLHLGPAPWMSGEVMRFSLKSGAGLALGDHRWSVEAVTVGGRAVWRVEQYMSITFNKTFQYSRVDADKDSFAPVSGLTRNARGDFSAVYGLDRVKLTTTISTNTTVRDIVAGRVAYDNEQALYVIRRMPLAEGYSGSFDIFSVQGGALVRCTITVTGKEAVTVPAGAFDCYKLDLAVFSGTIKALQHTLWISTDKRKLLVKYDAAGQMVEELIEVSQSKPGQKALFEDKDLGVSVACPVGWRFVKNPAPGNYKLEVELLPPELRAWAAFAVTASDGASSARAVAEKDIELLKGFFKAYTVRPASWRLSEIGGVPAATFAADYDDNGAEKVEYRTYLAGKSCVYWFVFRTGKAGFEAQKPEFDALVGSFNGK